VANSSELDMQVDTMILYLSSCEIGGTSEPLSPVQENATSDDGSRSPRRVKALRRNMASVSIPKRASRSAITSAAKLLGAVARIRDPGTDKICRMASTTTSVFPVPGLRNVVSEPIGERKGELLTARIQ
jgi:hypothetical protein